LIFHHFYQINFLVRKKLSQENICYGRILVEYPYVIPQPVENTQPSSPTNPLETVTTLTKNMKLNVNKTLEGQGYLLKIISSLNTFNISFF
jgi:hypothetical protein